MSEYEKKHGDDVVTIFGRKQILPPLDTERPITDKVPEIVTFEMPDRSLLQVATNQEILIGRKSKHGDTEVTVDLGAFDGHQHGVSRHHALVKYLKDTLFIVDLDSINGTFVNNRRALPTKRYALLDGDEIKLGSLAITIRYG